MCVFVCPEKRTVAECSQLFTPLKTKMPSVTYVEWCWSTTRGFFPDKLSSIIRDNRHPSLKRAAAYAKTDTRLTTAYRRIVRVPPMHTTCFAAKTCSNACTCKCRPRDTRTLQWIRQKLLLELTRHHVSFQPLCETTKVRKQCALTPNKTAL